MISQEIRFLTTPGGVRIACAISGNGPPLVKAPNWMSHVGFDWDSPIWRHWWQGLSSKNTLTRFDQRGCGLSDREVEDLSFDRWVDDLEFVADELGLDRFALLGMSQGASVALEYAARHPDRLSHLILYGGFPRGWAKRGGPIAEHSALLTLIAEGWGRDNDAYRQVFTSQFIPQGTAEQMRWFNELERVSASPEVAAAFHMEVGKIDVLDRLELVNTPALVFHSPHDARVPFDQGQQLASLIPGARFVALDSKNHLLLEEEPAWLTFLTEVHTFLGTGAAAPVVGKQSIAHPALSTRELEVLHLMADGKTDREIADVLFLSVRTVGNHVKHILHKTSSANRTEAAVSAARMGWV